MAREDLKHSREELDTTASGREFHRETHLMLKNFLLILRVHNVSNFVLMASGVKVVNRTREDFIWVSEDCLCKVIQY